MAFLSHSWNSLLVSIISRQVYKSQQMQLSCSSKWKQIRFYETRHIMGRVQKSMADPKMSPTRNYWIGSRNINHQGRSLNKVMVLRAGYLSLTQGWRLGRLDVVRENELGRDFTDDSKHWIILLIPASKFLAQNFLELYFVKRFSILSSMDLSQVCIVGGRLRNKSYLLIG